MPWPATKRFASVNNFGNIISSGIIYATADGRFTGFGGTNAHCVLEKSPKPLKGPPPKEVARQDWRVYILSGAAEGAVKQQMRNLEVYLEQRPEAFEIALMPNLAYTLCQRRSLLTWKLAVPAFSSRDLMEKLSAKSVTPIRSTGHPTLGFVFTGQGESHPAAGIPSSLAKRNMLTHIHLPRCSMACNGP